MTSAPAEGHDLSLRGRVAVAGCSTNLRSLSKTNFHPLCFTCKSQENREPTSGLEPLTCSLRVNCSYWTIRCFTLFNNRRYQRERRSVMRYIGRLAVRAAPIPYRGLGIALRFTSRSYKRRADKRTRTADLISLQ